MRHDDGDELQAVVIHEVANEQLQLRHAHFQPAAFEVRFGHGVGQVEDNHQVPEDAALRRDVDSFLALFPQILVVLR